MKFKMLCRMPIEFAFGTGRMVSILSRLSYLEVIISMQTGNSGSSFTAICMGST